MFVGRQHALSPWALLVVGGISLCLCCMGGEKSAGRRAACPTHDAAMRAPLARGQRVPWRIWEKGGRRAYGGAAEVISHVTKAFGEWLM